MNAESGELDSQWNSAPVANQMTLAASLRSACGIGTRLCRPQKLAATNCRLPLLATNQSVRSGVSVSVAAKDRSRVASGWRYRLIVVANRRLHQLSQVPIYAIASIHDPAVKGVES